MSSIVPIARTVVKKVTPKTKKGKVAAAGAAAFGIGIANRDDSKPTTTTTAPYYNNYCYYNYYYYYY